MPKEEWGVKRVCPTTGKRFYDLNKDPIVSPYTGEVLQLDTGKRAMLVADSADGAKRRASEDDVEDVAHRHRPDVVPEAAHLRLERVQRGHEARLVVAHG